MHIQLGPMYPYNDRTFLVAMFRSITPRLLQPDSWVMWGLDPGLSTRFERRSARLQRFLFALYNVLASSGVFNPTPSSAY